MEAFLHQILSGLAAGGIYASLALALVMIFPGIATWLPDHVYNKP